MKRKILGLLPVVATLILASCASPTDSVSVEDSLPSVSQDTGSSASSDSVDSVDPFDSVDSVESVDSVDEGGSSDSVDDGGDEGGGDTPITPATLTADMLAAAGEGLAVSGTRIAESNSTSTQTAFESSFGTFAGTGTGLTVTNYKTTDSGAEISKEDPQTSYYVSVQHSTLGSAIGVPYINLSNNYSFSLATFPDSTGTEYYLAFSAIMSPFTYLASYYDDAMFIDEGAGIYSLDLDYVLEQATEDYPATAVRDVIASQALIQLAGVSDPATLYKVFDDEITIEDFTIILDEDSIDGFSVSFKDGSTLVTSQGTILDTGEGVVAPAPALSTAETDADFEAAMAKLAEGNYTFTSTLGSGAAATTMSGKAMEGVVQVESGDEKYTYLDGTYKYLGMQLPAVYELVKHNDAWYYSQGFNSPLQLGASVADLLPTFNISSSLFTKEDDSYVLSYPNVVAEPDSFDFYIAGAGFNIEDLKITVAEDSVTFTGELVDPSTGADYGSLTTAYTAIGTTTITDDLPALEDAKEYTGLNSYDEMDAEDQSAIMSAGESMELTEQGVKDLLSFFYVAPGTALGTLSSTDGEMIAFLSLCEIKGTSIYYSDAVALADMILANLGLSQYMDGYDVFENVLSSPTYSYDVPAYYQTKLDGKDYTIGGTFYLIVAQNFAYFAFVPSFTPVDTGEPTDPDTGEGETGGEEGGTTEPGEETEPTPAE